MIDIGTIARWGTVIRVIIPALVAVDTVHSFYKVSQLYKARLKVTPLACIVQAVRKDASVSCVQGGCIPSRGLRRGSVVWKSDLAGPIQTAARNARAW